MTHVNENINYSVPAHVTERSTGGQQLSILLMYIATCLLALTLDNFLVVAFACLNASFGPYIHVQYCTGTFSSTHKIVFLILLLQFHFYTWQSV